MKTGPFDAREEDEKQIVITDAEVVLPPSVEPSAPPLEDEEIIQGEAVVPEEDIEAQAAATVAREEGTQLIRDHLDAHLTQNPDSSYVSWIATLHPENATVLVDPRFLIPGNPWMTVYEEVLIRHTAPGEVTTPSERIQNSESSDSPTYDSQDVKGGRLCGYSGFLDMVVGMSLELSAVLVAFAIEIGSLFCYQIAVVCFKISKTFSNPRVTLLSCLPYAISIMLYQILILVDTILLISSICAVELFATVSFMLCALFGCSCKAGRSAHQRTRRLAHLTRWACRHPFDQWEPSRVSFQCCGCANQVEKVKDSNETISDFPDYTQK